MNLSKLAKYAIPVVITLAQPAFGLEKKINEENDVKIKAEKSIETKIFKEGSNHNAVFIIPSLKDALWMYYNPNKQKINELADELKEKFDEDTIRIYKNACRMWPLIEHYSSKFDYDLISAFRVCATESGFENVRGKCGEYGPFQLMGYEIDRITKKYKHLLPEPEKGMRESVPNQTAGAILLLKEISEKYKGTSLRTFVLEGAYKEYCCGQGWRYSPKLKRIVRNLRLTKEYEELTLYLEAAKEEIAKEKYELSAKK
jgi:hypothetical protein